MLKFRTQIVKLWSLCAAPLFTKAHLAPLPTLDSFTDSKKDPRHLTNATSSKERPLLYVQK